MNIYNCTCSCWQLAVAVIVYRYMIYRIWNIAYRIFISRNTE